MSGRTQCELCGCTIYPGEKKCRGCGTLQEGTKKRTIALPRLGQLLEKAFVPAVLILSVAAVVAIIAYVFPAPLVLGPGKRLLMILGILSFATAALMIVDAAQPGPEGEQINQGETLKLFISCVLVWFAVVPMYMKARAALRGPDKKWEYQSTATAVAAVLFVTLIAAGFTFARHYEQNKNQEAAQEILKQRIENFAKPPQLSVTPAP